MATADSTYGWAAMRVVGYVRVSTDRQVDAGAALDTQRRAVRHTEPRGTGLST